MTNVSSNIFLERQALEHEIQLQLLADEEKHKMSKKPTTLFYQGNQTSPNNVRQCLYNLNAICSFISPEFSKSTCWKALALYLRALDSPNGRRWLEDYSYQPHIIHGCVMDIQNILGKFVAVAFQLPLRLSIQNNENLPPEPLREAFHYATQITNKLSYTIANACPDAYATKPLTFGLFTTTSPPKSSKDNKSKDNGSSDDKENKKPKKDSDKKPGEKKKR